MILRRAGSLIRAVLLIGAACVGLLAAAPGFLGLNVTTVAGSSMTGSIPLGSIALSRTVQARDVKTGQVIVFVPPGGRVPTIHRIVNLKRGHDGVIVATTKGDANPKPDPERVKMKGSGELVVSHLPYLGYAMHYIHRMPPVFYAALFALMLLVGPTRDRFRRGRTDLAAT